MDLNGKIKNCLLKFIRFMQIIVEINRNKIFSLPNTVQFDSPLSSELMVNLDFGCRIYFLLNWIFSVAGW